MKRIGKHKLYRGDCLKLMSKIPDHSVDMVLCDLPYGTTACKWDSVIPFPELWEHYNRIIKPGGAFVLFAQQPFTSSLVLSNIDNFRYQWVWEKNRGGGFLDAKKKPLRCHEDIVVFYNSACLYNPQMLEGRPNNAKNKAGVLVSEGKSSEIHKGSYDRRQSDLGTAKYPRSVLCFDGIPPTGGVRVHPTQKPVDLCAYLIRTYTNAGMTVLDNTMGSGTTGVACVQESRKFIGIEQDPKYFEIACQRIREARHRKRVGPPIRDVKKKFISLG